MATENTYILSIKDNGQWIEIPAIKGDAGPQGPQGIQGEQGIPGVGVPTGGTTGQILAKVDGTDYNTQWVNAGSGEINVIEVVQENGTPLTVTNKTVNVTVPTKVSDLQNDSGFITSWGQADWNESDNSAPSYILNKPTIPAAQVNSDWNSSSGVSEILNKPTIPTNVSDLNNDSGFITSWGQADWNQTDNSEPDYIKNKPTIPAAQVNSDWNASTGVAEILNKPTLATVATTGDYGDLLNTPTIPAAQVNSDWDAVSGVSQILNKPSLATVATSGSYTDLSNTPAIPTKVSDLQNDSGFITSWGQADWNQSDNTASDYIKNKPSIPAAQVNADWNSSSGVSEILNKPSLATVATTGSYTDLSNTPAIPAAQVNSDWTASSGVAEILHKPTIPTQAQAIASGDTGYATGDQVYQVVGDVESLLLALRGNV